MKKYIAVMVSGLVVLAVGCKKNDERPKLPAGHPSLENTLSTGMPELPKVDRAVIVPKEVRETWRSVKLAVQDKATGSTKEYTVAVGSELALPNTRMTVSVLAFVPDFRMGDKDITSASDKPNNPAVQIAVREPGKAEWRGWLYSLHPGVHPFDHDKIALALVSGIAGR